MIKYIFQCLTTKYCDFDGRASLAEFFSFWFFWGLIFTLFAIAVNVIDNESVNLTLTGVFLFIMLLLFYPASAVTVRRLHDGDLPGWMILLVFAGCPGIIFVFLLAIIGDHDCRDDNKYGPALPENTGKWNDDEDFDDEDFDDEDYDDNYDDDDDDDDYDDDEEDEDYDDEDFDDEDFDDEDFDDEDFDDEDFDDDDDYDDDDDDDDYDDDEEDENK